VPYLILQKVTVPPPVGVQVQFSAVEASPIDGLGDALTLWLTEGLTDTDRLALTEGLTDARTAVVKYR